MWCAHCKWTVQTCLHRPHAVWVSFKYALTNQFGRLTISVLLSHTHNIGDRRNCCFTVRFAGLGENPGLRDGIRTMEEFLAQMKESFKQISFEIYTKVALFHFSKLFRGWLNYSYYGTPRKLSKAALAQGGRDPEPHHFHFFQDEKGVIVMQYKYDEISELYLPRNQPIPVSFSPKEIMCWYA